MGNLHVCYTKLLILREIVMASKPISLEEVKDFLEDHPEWFLIEDEGQVSTGLEFESFHEAAGFLHDLSHLAEEVGHHPDVFIYDVKFMQVLVHTHDANDGEGGFTEKDFEFIKAFDEAYGIYDDSDDEEDMPEDEGVEE